MSNLDNVLNRLDKVTKLRNGKYKALCPCHDDKTPSLAISEVDDRLLIHCFGGCEPVDVLGSIGLTFADIMPKHASGNFKKEKKPFYALDILSFIQFEASLVYLYASDMAKGLMLTSQDKERLLLSCSRINHAYRVANHGL